MTDRLTAAAVVLTAFNAGAVSMGIYIDQTRPRPDNVSFGGGVEYIAYLCDTKGCPLTDEWKRSTHRLDPGRVAPFNPANVWIAAPVDGPAKAAKSPPR